MNTDLLAPLRAFRFLPAIGGHAHDGDALLLRLGPVAALEESFAGKGYGDLKGEVAEVVVAAIEPFQTRMNTLLADPAELDRILLEGSAKAREVAGGVLSRVREALGLLPRGR